MNMNFDFFQIQTRMLQTVRAEKVDEKHGVICLVPCFLSKLWSLHCPKKYIFCNFVLTSARNLSLLKRFPYMHVKVLITLFQKMIWFIGV